jgi:outer membrane immunogenic protein
VEAYVSRVERSPIVTIAPHGYQINPSLPRTPLSKRPRGILLLGRTYDLGNAQQNNLFQRGAVVKKLLLAGVAFVVLTGGGPRSALAAPDEASARLEAIEKENAILRKENAALRERAELGKENTVLRERVERKESTAVRERVEHQKPTSAYAAIPVKAPVYTALVAPAYNWSGWYVGLNAGYGWGRDTQSEWINGDGNTQTNFILFDGKATSFRPSGAIGGAQIGYNWLPSPKWLIGLEADINASGVSGSASTRTLVNGQTALPFTIDGQRKLEWFGTVRGRLGYVPLDGLLIYATGGLVYGEISQSTSFNNHTPFNFANFACNGAVQIVCYAGSENRLLAGWTVGAGFEYFIAPNVTLKAEYLYMDLGGSHVFRLNNVTFPSTHFMTMQTNDAIYNIARIGVNYKFAGPVVARY